MKRRLKTEIYNKKKFQQIDKNSEEAKEFEESLLRLAQLAKNRIKLSDFTSRDKCNLLDLFVNNEKTLLKFYEALFPHRASQPQQASAMAAQPVREGNKLLNLSTGTAQQFRGSNPVFASGEQDTAAETKFDQRFPGILPAINEAYGNTMVEFGSLRGSGPVPENK